jgi:hypothetical protein
MNGMSRNEYRERTCAVVVRGLDVLPGRDSAANAGTQRPGLLEWLRDELAVAWAACGTFEFVALGYLGISSALILLFAENVVHPLRLLGTQALVAAAILALCWKEARVLRRATLPRESAGFPDVLHADAIQSHRAPGTKLGFAGSAAPATFSQRFWHFWRHWYPHLFFLFCFEEMGKLVHLVQPGWQDAMLIAFDHWLTGVNPSLWLERFGGRSVLEPAPGVG